MSEERELLNQVIVTPDLPLSAHLHSIIVRRIWLGEYPVGQLLPSTRLLAKELGVNRNTVSKVYQQLNQEGWVVSIPGKGVLVVKRIGRGGILSTTEVVAQHLDDVIREARVSGIDQGRLRNLIETSISAHYEGRFLKLAFVECSEKDAVELSEELRLATLIPVEPVLFDDFRENVQKYASFDLVVTTFYHLNEVQDVLNQCCAGAEVVAIQVNPVPDILLDMANLKPGKNVGIVAANERTARVISSILQVYNAAVHVRAIVLDVNGTELEDLASWADIIIDSQSVHDVVRKAMPDQGIITIRFQIRQQSIEFLRSKILERVSLN